MEDVRMLQALIVEDDPNWLEALERMYNSVFQGIPLRIESCSDKDTAEAKLSERRWDIVSLDINLHGDKKPVAGKSELMANLVGQDVIHQIAEEDAAKFVIVVSGIESDREILGMTFVGDRVLEEKLMSLEDELRALFPKHWIYLRKNPERDISRNIDIFKKRLGSEVNMNLILEAVGLVNRLEQVSENDWRIKFNGRSGSFGHKPGLCALVKLLENPRKMIGLSELDPDITPKSKSATGSSKVESRDNDNLAYQDSTEIAFEDYGGSGISFPQLKRDEKEYIKGVIECYINLVRQARHDLSDEERDKVVSDITVTEELLKDAGFGPKNISSLRREQDLPEWLVDKLASKNIDVNRMPRDRLYTQLRRIRKDLVGKNFEEFASHIARIEDGGSLWYRKGFYQYMPKYRVKWNP